MMSYCKLPGCLDEWKNGFPIHIMKNDGQCIKCCIIDPENQICSKTSICIECNNSKIFSQQLESDFKSHCENED